jgi:dienelactone hydrolase
MPRLPRRWSRVALALLALLLVAYWMARPTLRSAALLMDMTGAAPKLRPWIPATTYDVSTEDIEVPTRHGTVRARLYRSSAANPPALVVVPGVHGGGVDEPRLASLSRRIAAAGATVLSAPMPDLRAYRLTTRATDMIEDTTLWMASQPQYAPAHRVGLIGVSFAGGLALVAAGRPALQNRLTAVFALGAHADLPRTIRYLCMDENAPKTLSPPHDYGVVLMLRASIALVVPAGQQAPLDAALVTFLDASSAEATDRSGAERLFSAARMAESALGEPAKSLMHAVNTRDVHTLGRLLAPHAEQIGGAAAMSPSRSPATRAPVFLLHGVEDNVIPSSESGLLRDYLMSAGNRDVEFLLTPLISHADARVDAGAQDVWRLVRFWTRMWGRLEK